MISKIFNKGLLKYIGKAFLFLGFIFILSIYTDQTHNNLLLINNQISNFDSSGYNNLESLKQSKILITLIYVGEILILISLSIFEIDLIYKIHSKYVDYEL